MTHMLSRLRASPSVPQGETAALFPIGADCMLLTSNETNGRYTVLYIIGLYTIIDDI
jgi:hypothetical protein